VGSEQWPGTHLRRVESSGSTGKRGPGPYDLAQSMREQSRTVVRGATQ
jgi:hypothetical protein